MAWCQERKGNTSRMENCLMFRELTDSKKNRAFLEHAEKPHCGLRPPKVQT